MKDVSMMSQLFVKVISGIMLPGEVGMPLIYGLIYAPNQTLTVLM